ncbi:MAG: prepilin-type N-terminal cleavage/methylation domain-containing protein [Gemmataceae bacterium]|nr:prepilin-type N-terminal cleavage/methylation domain-containing protein [Gemmataceae bacterium]
MAKRQGVTLIEVLVAIFIMGVGLMALLTLFPLGALSMSRAIRDDRAAAAANYADKVAALKRIRDPKLFFPLSADPFVTNPAIPNLTIDPEGPSFPVYVDPAGYRNAAGLPSDVAVAGAPGALTRRSVNWALTTPLVLRWFSVIDDLVFDKDTGLPSKVNGPIERDIGYSFAYLLHRPKVRDETIVHCDVAVYQRRPMGLSGQLTLEEFIFDSAKNPGTASFFNPIDNTITIRHGGNFPNIRSGDWILDVSLVSMIPTKPGLQPKIMPHSFFYRVVGLDEINATDVKLDVQTPLRGWTYNGNDYMIDPATIDPTLGAYNGTTIYLEGVVDVFERGLGR